MSQEKTLQDNLTWVKGEVFFMRLEDTTNGEPMFFAPTKKLLRSEMDPTSAGYFVWSWLKSNDLSAVYYSFDFKHADAYTLVFETAKARDSYTTWYAEKLRPIEFKSEWVYELYGDDAALLKYIKKSEHGYYLSSGHKVPSTDSFDLFHWLQTHTKSPVFKLSDSRLYFTDKNEELEFKLAWINETT